MYPRYDQSHGVLNENASRLFEQMREAIRRGDELASAVAEMIGQSAQTFQNVLQSCTALAAQTTEHSAANINSTMNGMTSLTDTMRSVSLDWLRFSQGQVEQGFGHVRSIASSAPVLP